VRSYDDVFDEGNDAVGIALWFDKSSDARCFVFYRRAHRELGDRKFRDVLSVFLGDLKAGDRFGNAGKVLTWRFKREMEVANAKMSA